MEKKKELTLECTMHQRLLFVLLEDKQTMQRDESKYFHRSNISFTYCLEVRVVRTLCIAISAVGPLAFAKPKSP
jgi:hypothetical protein